MAGTHNGPLLCIHGVSMKKACKFCESRPEPTTPREILLALVEALSDTEVADALELLEEAGIGTVGSA